MKLKKIGKFYHAQFKTAEGQKSVSTKATNIDDATRFAKEAGIAQLEHAAQAGRITAEVIGRITTGRKLTNEKAIAEFSAWQKSVGASSRTIENNAAWLRAWLDWGKGLATMPPGSVTEKHIAPFINRTDIRAGAASRAVMLSALRSYFDFCSAKGYSIGNPAKLVRVNYDLLSHEQKERKEVQPFTEAEYRKLLRYIDDVETNPVPNQIFWRIAVRLDWETGLRISDVACIEWDCFRISGKVIVWTGKRDKRVAVPISDELSNLITEIPVVSDRYLFPVQRQIALDEKRRALLPNQFIRMTQAAGIEGKSFHSLRHAFVTRMHKAGKTLDDIGQLVGHANTKTTKGYVHG